MTRGPQSAPAERAFAQIAERLRRDPAVDDGTGFSTNPGLRTHGKIFAMLVVGQLVVKLPAKRCDHLVAAGIAERFERGQGRPLKQWVSLGECSACNWLEIADEALRSA